MYNKQRLAFKSRSSLMVKHYVANVRSRGSNPLICYNIKIDILKSYSIFLETPTKIKKNANLKKETLNAIPATIGFY